MKCWIDAGFFPPPPRLSPPPSYVRQCPARARHRSDRQQTGMARASTWACGTRPRGYSLMSASPSRPTRRVSRSAGKQRDAVPPFRPSAQTHACSPQLLPRRSIRRSQSHQHRYCGDLEESMIQIVLDHTQRRLSLQVIAAARSSPLRLPQMATSPIRSPNSNSPAMVRMPGARPPPTRTAP